MNEIELTDLMNLLRSMRATVLTEYRKQTISLVMIRVQDMILSRDPREFRVGNEVQAIFGFKTEVVGIPLPDWPEFGHIYTIVETAVSLNGGHWVRIARGDHEFQDWFPADRFIDKPPQGLRMLDSHWEDENHPLKGGEYK